MPRTKPNEVARTVRRRRDRELLRKHLERKYGEVKPVLSNENTEAK